MMERNGKSEEHTMERVVRDPPDCGTPGTLPCPPPETFLDLRARAIDTIAGKETTTQRRQGVTAAVDSYLGAMLDDLVALVNTTKIRYIADVPTVEIVVAGGERRLVVREGAQPSTIAAALQALQTTPS